MKTSKRIVDHSAFGQNWGVFLTWGIVLAVLGFIAISAAIATTVITVVILGILLMLGGIVLLFDTFTYWRHKPGFALHIMIGLLYLFGGIALIVHPVESSVSLTLLLGVLFLILGVIRMFFSFSLRSPQWGWGFFNGLLTFVLGILILSNWPEASLFIIGIFVGIDLLFCGLAYIVAALSVRHFKQ